MEDEETGQDPDPRETKPSKGNGPPPSALSLRYPRMSSGFQDPEPGIHEGGDAASVNHG